MNADAIHRKRPRVTVGVLGVGKRFSWKLSSTCAMLALRWEI